MEDFINQFYLLRSSIFSLLISSLRSIHPLFHGFMVSWFSLDSPLVVLHISSSCTVLWLYFIFLVPVQSSGCTLYLQFLYSPLVVLHISSPCAVLWLYFISLVPVQSSGCTSYLQFLYSPLVVLHISSFCTVLWLYFISLVPVQSSGCT